jgi:hypothetical protein
MAQLYRVDGTIETVQPKNGTDFSLEELKGYIGGGLIEAVPVFGDKLIIVDEEGLIRNLQYNNRASMLVKGRVNGDIVGDMVLIKRSEFK